MKITHKGITVNLSSYTYEPAEDTFLLLDTCLDTIEDFDSVLEIGSGSGIISAILKHKKNISIIATDINPHAARCTRSNNIETIRANLFNGIKGTFDVIIFNPPYLPTSEDEKIPGWLNYAFDGGSSGTDTLFQFIDQAQQHLKERGTILTIISSLTDINTVTNKMRQQGYTVTTMGSEKHFFEKLIVLRGTLND